MAKFYRFNLKGDLLVDKTYDEISYPFGINKEFVPVRKGKKWGIAFNDTLELKVPIQYDRIEFWLFAKSHRLMVWNGDDFSIIDIENNVLIEPKYDFINFEKNDQKYGIVSFNGKKGIIDKKGEIIIETKYDSCDIALDNKFILISDNKIEMSDEFGKIISNKISGERVIGQNKKINGLNIVEYFLLINNGKYGVLDKDFNKVLECQYDDYINFINNNQFFVVLNGENLVLNNQNKVIKKFNYSFSFGSEHLLSNGKYNYIVRKDKSYGAKCGIMDENFEIILPIEYDWIDFSNDVWVIRKGRSEYILDEKYNLIDASKNKRIGKFEKEGIACVQREDLKYSFIKKNGQFSSKNIFDFVQLGSRSLLDYLFENINSRYRSGLCGVCLNSKWGYLDLNGNILIDCKFDEITEFDSRKNAIVKFNGKWGVIDNKGKSIIPFEFDSIVDYSLQHNLIISIMEDKFGLIDFNNKIIIDHEYDKIEFDNEKILFGYAKKPVSKKIISKIKLFEPIDLLESKFLIKHSNLIHNDLKRVMVLAVVSGEEDYLSNRLYIIDVIKKDNTSATFISGYAGGGVWDECTFINDKEYNGEEGGFTVFDYIKDDQYVKGLVANYICEIDDELDEYQYKSLKYFTNVGKEDLKVLYSVWYNEAEDYTQISKNDKKRFKKLLKSTGGIWWNDWNFKF
jgi:hypothetical protein